MGLNELELSYLDKCEVILNINTTTPNSTTTFDEDSDIEVHRSSSPPPPTQSTANSQLAVYTDKYSDPFDFRTTKCIAGEHVIGPINRFQK